MNWGRRQHKQHLRGTTNPKTSIAGGRLYIQTGVQGESDQITTKAMGPESLHHGPAMIIERSGSLTSPLML